MGGERHKKVEYLAAGTYPIIHAKSLIVRIFDVVPAVQTSGIRIRFVEFLPHHVFLRTVEVAETPSPESFGTRRWLASLHRGWSALDGADKGDNSKAKKE